MKKSAKINGKLAVRQETIRSLSDLGMRAMGGKIISRDNGCTGAETCNAGNCNPSDMTLCPV